MSDFSKATREVSTFSLSFNYGAMRSTKWERFYAGAWINCVECKGVTEVMISPVTIDLLKVGEFSALLFSFRRHIIMEHPDLISTLTNHVLGCLNCQSKATTEDTRDKDNTPVVRIEIGLNDVCAEGINLILPILEK